MMNERLHSIMTTEVVSLTPDQTLADARDLFLKGKIHHLPVLEGRTLVGIITSWDMFKLGLSAAEYGPMKARDIMTTKIATLDPDQHIGAAAEVLMAHLFHAVPVVNDDHELLGIVTSYDLLRYEYSKEYPEDLTRFVPDNM